MDNKEKERMDLIKSILFRNPILNVDKLKGLTIEQLNQYYIDIKNINEFANEMKTAWLEKTLQGYSGYSDKNVLIDFDKEISCRVENRFNSEENLKGRVSIGIANWLFIHWFRLKNN